MIPTSQRFFDPAQNLRSDMFEDSKRNGSVVNFIIAAVSQEHRDHCSRIVTFNGDAAMLCSILLRSVQFHYDLATTKALPR